MRVYIIIISIICSGFSVLQAQYIRDKASFYIGYQSGSYLGQKQFTDAATTAVSFYRNFQTTNALVSKISYDLSDHISEYTRVEY